MSLTVAPPCDRYFQGVKSLFLFLHVPMFRQVYNSYRFSISSVIPIWQPGIDDQSTRFLCILHWKTNVAAAILRITTTLHFLVTTAVKIIVEC